MDDLSRFCCQNSRCPDFGRRNAGNLTVTGRLGKSGQFRLLYCRSCRARFSERKGTPLYRAHLPGDKVASILEQTASGRGGWNAELGYGVLDVAAAVARAQTASAATVLH